MMIELLLLAALCCGAEPGSAPESGEYREQPAKSFPIREKQHLELDAYLSRLMKAANAKRKDYFNPDFSSLEAYEASTAKRRQDFLKMIGYPPPLVNETPAVRMERIAEEPSFTIDRVWIEVLDGVEVYGLYLVPKALKGKAPLLVAIHGGQGTPEALCGIHDYSNYHQFGREAAKRGYVVWAPALLMPARYAGDPFPGEINRFVLDKKAKLVGTSVLAIECYKIIRGAQHLAATHDEIDADRIGLTGLSYGGYYTMNAGAISNTFKASLCSALFGEQSRALLQATRQQDLWVDMQFLNIVDQFGYAQLCGMICPRPLMIQCGVADKMVPIEDARREAARAAEYYEKLGIADKFEYFEHAAGHEYDIEGSFKFFEKYLSPLE